MLLPVSATADLAVAEDSSLSFGATGNESLLWLYCVNPVTDGKQSLLNFVLLPPKGHERFVAPVQLRGLVGRVHDAVVRDLDLHVIYDEGTHRRYRFTPGLRTLHPSLEAFSELPLPNNSTPLALGAGARDQVVAVVTKQIALDIVQQLNDRALARAKEQADESEDFERPEPVQLESEDSQLYLVGYSGVQWQLPEPIPVQLGNPSKLLLVADPSETIHILYSPSNGRGWKYASRTTAGWEEPIIVEGSGEHELKSLLLFPERLVAVGRRAQTGQLVTFGMELSDRPKWQKFTALETPQTSGLNTAAEVAGARYDKALAVAWRNSSGEVVYGLWPIKGGSIATGPTVVDALGNMPTGRGQNHPETFIPFAILAGLLIFAFWRRQSSITKTLNLPAHFVVASIWRRLAGFILDAAPISMLTFFYWYPPLERLMDPYRQLEAAEMHSPLLSMEMLKSWFISCGAYTLYCMICEALFTLTPGKLAVQCHVVNEEGHRCNLGQIVVRNLLRLIELFPLFQMWPTFILMLFTRNRQRLGDLIARSIVVERVHPSRQRTPQNISADQDPTDSKRE